MIPCSAYSLYKPTIGSSGLGVRLQRGFLEELPPSVEMNIMPEIALIYVNNTNINAFLATNNNIQYAGIFALQQSHQICDTLI